MALTPNTLVLQRDRLRLLLQEPAALYWTNAQLNQYINEAQLNVAVGAVPSRVSGLEFPLLASEAFTASVVDQELYSLPPNFYALRTVRMKQTSTATYQEMPQVDVEYARVHPRTSAPTAEAYFLWGESGTYQLGMYPAFNTATATIWATYWRTPTEMTSDPDVLQLPLELHVANTYLAAHKAWLERSHQLESEAMLNMFIAEYTAYMVFITRTQINSKRAIMVGTIGDTDTERTLY